MWKGPYWTFLGMELKQAMLTLKKLLVFFKSAMSEHLFKMLLVEKLIFQSWYNLNHFILSKYFFSLLNDVHSPVNSS